ncbi:MAG TPA: ABC transporter ATP-binding protein [Modicisalibacter sp.]|nr:ABC transporter ATP-binding protein [Modicisalibacter sp.]
MTDLAVHVDEKRFDDALILSDLEFAAKSGEFIALVGPSGAGKSTLLNMIAGLDTDYRGAVRWNDAPLQAQGQPPQSSPRSSPRLSSRSSPRSSPKSLGMMFQEPRLMPWLSTLDNVRLVQPLSDERDSAERASNLLREVGLGEALDAWPNQLSGGMQRRAALARAFMVSPRLLLMDEPFVSLDMPTANRLRDLLLALYRRERPVVLFVTHDLREALTLADRILFMSARPARIMLDYAVPLSRPRELEGIEISRLQHALFDEHPELLSGVLNDPVPSNDAH